MTSHQVKDQVRDCFESGFDTLHRIADLVTFPLAPLDGAIHGTARGVLNWLTDTHPGESNSRCLPTNTSVPYGQSFWPPVVQQQQYPQYGGNYGSPPSPPPYNYSNYYWNGPGQGQPQLPYYGSQGIQNVENGNYNNANHNNGAIKVANFGGA